MLISVKTALLLLWYCFIKSDIEINRKQHFIQLQFGKYLLTFVGICINLVNILNLVTCVFISESSKINQIGNKLWTAFNADEVLHSVTSMKYIAQKHTYVLIKIETKTRMYTIAIICVCVCVLERHSAK